VSFVVRTQGKAMAEISLLDTHGNAVAYIADDGEASIYLWTGEAVAYVVLTNSGTLLSIFSIIGLI
jgi:hypothetical protein